jgi:2'-5' RNA ligase
MKVLSNRKAEIKNINGQMSLFPSIEQKKFVSPTIFQYQIVIALPAEITERIEEIRRLLKTQVYLGANNMRFFPYIVINSFCVEKVLEKDIGLRFQQLFSDERPFTINLNSFNYFNLNQQAKTIYLGVNDGNVIETFYKKLAFVLKETPKKYVPHVAVTNEISESVFDLVFPSIKNILFEATFDCKHLLILERSMYNGIVSNFSVFKEVNLYDSAFLN